MLQSRFMYSETELMVAQACDPSLHEPNYAQHIQIAEHIKAKKANTPREAAMMIAKLANNRNPHVAILVLALLDTLVQTCGYPFHLQIATKEFLNELVRRFPERPPPFPGPVMSKILELIHTWKETICTDSRYKDDFGNIKDMHRLLTFKGYRFRDMPRRRDEVQASTSNLKSAEELEEEDRAAQSAKLQELIRRGTPRDLAAAQELMKSLAGALPESAKPDYRTQALNELNKLEAKVILMNEMLDNVDTTRGERFASGDVYDQVASILTAARPKIQKWISDAENDDSESLDTFLQINDQINTVLTRYESFKRGDYTAASNPIPSELRQGGAAAPTSLIDFDDEVPATTAGPQNDLAGLFGSAPSPQPQPQTQTQTNFFAATSSPQPPQYQQQPQQYHQQPNLFQPQALSMGQFAVASSPAPATNTPPASIMLPSTPGPTSPSTSFANQMGSNVGNGMGMGMGGYSSPNPMMMGNGSRMSSMGAQPQQPQQPQQQTTSSAQAGKDPFADLAGLF